MSAPLKQAVSTSTTTPISSLIKRPPIFQQPYSLRKLNAIVVSSGLMDKTVKVSVGIQEWNNHIRKKFSRNRYLLVHDPRSSLRTGDVISISPGWRASKNVHHIVDSIIAPFGPPLSARPPVMTLTERLAEREERARLKAERKNKTWSAGTKARKEKIRQEILGGLDIDEVIRREWEELIRLKPKNEDGSPHTLDMARSDAEELEWKRLRKQTIMMARARKRMLLQTEPVKKTMEMLDARKREIEERTALKEMEAGMGNLGVDDNSGLPLNVVVSQGET